MKIGKLVLNLYGEAKNPAKFKEQSWSFYRPDSKIYYKVTVWWRCNDEQTDPGNSGSNNSQRKLIQLMLPQAGRKADPCQLQTFYPLHPILAHTFHHCLSWSCLDCFFQYSLNTKLPLSVSRWLVAHLSGICLISVTELVISRTSFSNFLCSFCITFCFIWNLFIICSLFLFNFKLFQYFQFLGSQHSYLCDCFPPLIYWFLFMFVFSYWLIYAMSVSCTWSYEESFMFTSERKPESSWMIFPPSLTLDKGPLPGFTQEQRVECSQFLKPGRWGVAPELTQDIQSWFLQLTYTCVNIWPLETQPQTTVRLLNSSLLLSFYFHFCFEYWWSWSFELIYVSIFKIAHSPKLRLSHCWKLEYLSF